MYKFLTPYTLAGFEPGIFSYVFERDDHYATPPGREKRLFLHKGKIIYTLKTRYASFSVVTHSRGIGSGSQSYDYNTTLVLLHVR
jgi:hypothetical protein